MSSEASGSKKVTEKNASTATADPPETGKAQAQRTKTGCQNCRLRHLKCDDKRPSCARCSKAGIECVRGYNIRFRHGANPSIKDSSATKTNCDFSKSQQWVKTARTLTFLDETQELMNIYDHSPDENNQYPRPFQWPLERTQSAPVTSSQNTTAAAVTSSPLDRTQTTRPPQDKHDLAAHAAPSPVWPGANVASPRGGDKRSQISESPADSLAYSDQYPDTTTYQPKRRRPTFETTYHGSNVSESPMSVAKSPANSWNVNGWAASSSLDDLTAQSGIDITFAGAENTVSATLSRIYLDVPCWPLKDREEAILLRHFVERLARNFDLTDPRKHFRTVVPQRAAVCPTLMNAIFALSARHLSRIGSYDPLVSNRYHQETLKYLIPTLDSTDAILDENLLASLIILRHLEEVEVPLSGQSPSDQSSHLLGAQAFIAAQERAAVFGGLRQAAFWVGLRQEVYVAFVNQRPVLPALEHCNVDRSFDAAEDHVWSCRMVVLCADVLRFCFGEAPQTIDGYRYLETQVETWWSCKPSSFTPVFYREPEGEEIFPYIWYVSDEYATGIQHFHLARILLSSYNPSIPRLGPSRAAALKAMDEEIRLHVAILCGICRSNPSTAPAFTYASMAVTMAGDKFTKRNEQEALIEILQECDTKHAWPTGHAIENLKAAWGWEESALLADMD
ncbi:putative zn(2)-C6 fungal-type DNA-binding domain, fungal transcription factor [Septoria linicola]|nr:putative zn(2)-C6 fungal-type DNA-binding domain, fungal transcription factor [Septoria linicola]